MYKNAKVYVAGHTGLIGSAVVAKLVEQGCECIITETHDQLDLANGMAVSDFISSHCPDYVFLAAGMVGGIQGNQKYPAGYYHTKELACLIKKIVGYAGEILWDTSKPDGAAKKLLDSHRFVGLGWQPKVALEDGIRRTYQWYLKSVQSGNGARAS